MSRYTNLVDTFTKLYYGTSATSDQRQEIAERIARNAELPKNAATTASVVSRMKSQAEILTELGDLQSSFRSAVQEEMELGLASVERLRTLEYAMKSPTMNLGVISNSQVRRQLESQWQEIVRTSRSFFKLRITFSFSSFWKS